MNLSPRHIIVRNKEEESKSSYFQSNKKLHDQSDESDASYEIQKSPNFKSKFGYNDTSQEKSESSIENSFSFLP